MLLYVLLVFTSGSATTLNLLSLSVAFLDRVLRDLSLFEVSFLSSLFMFWVLIWRFVPLLEMKDFLDGYDCNVGVASGDTTKLLTE